eukprot:gene16780-35209_t
MRAHPLCCDPPRRLRLRRRDSGRRRSRLQERGRFARDRPL